MFHKPRLLEIYVTKNLVYLARFVLSLISAYFAYIAYSIVVEGYVSTRSGVVSMSSSPARYILEVVYMASLSAFCIFLLCSVRIKDNRKDK